MRKSYYFIILIISIFFVYGNTLSNGYNFDDDLVTKNQKVTSRDSKKLIGDIFKSSYHSEYGYNYGYRPITTLSFWLENRLFDESASMSHIINFLLYCCVILLLITLLHLVFYDVNPYVLLFIGLLFVVHSIHSEVVASIKNRDEILALLFLEIGVYFSFNFIKSKRLILLPLIIFSISLSLLSKKSGFSIIVLMPFFFFLKYQLNFRRLLYLIVCFCLPVSIFLFNLNPQKGFLIFFGSVLIYALIFYFTSNEIFKSLIKEKSRLFFIPFFLSLILFSIALIFNEQLLFLIAFGILTFYINFRFNVSVVLLMSASFVGYYFFNNNWFILFNVLLLSLTLILPNINKKFAFTMIFFLIAAVYSFVFQMGNWVYSIIYFIPLIVFITSKVHRVIPIIIAVLSTLLGLIFYTISIFHFGLIIGGLLILSMESSNFNHYLKGGLVLWVFLIFSTSIYYSYNENGSLFQTLEQKEEMAEQFVEKRTTNLQEGRQLEYMENTLVAPHTLEQRIATGAVVLGEYFRLMMFPKELSFYYGYSKIQTSDFTDYKVWLSLLIHLLLFFLMAYTYQKHPLVSFGLLWYFAAILLFSNWPVLVAGMVGERLAFIASVGFCIAIGGVLNWIKPNFNLKKPKAIELVALSVLVLFSVRTIARNRLWESPEKLMSNDIAHLQNSAQANYMLAMTTVKDVVENTVPSQESYRRLNGAIQHFQKAIEVYPDFYNYHYDLGRTFVVLENYKEAKNAFEKAYKLEPNALISLDELVKASFDLNEYADVIKYGKLYLNKSNNNYIIYELVAYSAFLVKDYQLARELITEGLGFYPNNQNLNGLLLDVNNADQQ